MPSWMTTWLKWQFPAEWQFLMCINSLFFWYNSSVLWKKTLLGVHVSQNWSGDQSVHTCCSECPWACLWQGMPCCHIHNFLRWHNKQYWTMQKRWKEKNILVNYEMLLLTFLPLSWVPSPAPFLCPFPFQLLTWAKMGRMKECDEVCSIHEPRSSALEVASHVLGQTYYYLQLIDTNINANILLPTINRQKH